MKRLVGLMLIFCMLFAVIGSGNAETPASKGYGFIDRDGNIVIEPQFQYAYSFHADRARIFTGTISSWGYYPDEGLYGYIDPTGNEIIPLIYEKAEDFAENGKAAVCKNGKYGIIDINGKAVVDFSYDYISYDSSAHVYKAFNGTLTSYGSPQSGTYHILDDDCKEKCSITCDYLYTNEGFIEAQKNKKYAIYSYDGEKKTDYIFESLGILSDSLISFKKTSDGKYGYVDVNGNIVIEPTYDSANKFIDGKAVVKKNKTYYLIDKKGQIITTYKVDYMDSSFISGYTYGFEGSLSDYGYPNEGKYYLMDIDGNYISRGYKKGNCYSVSNGTWRVQENNTWYVLDLTGKELFSIPNCEGLYNCGEDRYTAKKGGFYALLDSKGNVITDYIWDNMSSTSEQLIAVYTAGNEPDFRSVRWGMTEEEVKALEGSNPGYTGKLDGRNAKYIGYDSTLMGNDVILAFYFGPDGLYEARYIWAESHSNDSLYITDYNNVKSQLTKKYGSPWWDKENWDTTTHQKNYSDDKGRALSYGYLSYETEYNTPRTNIAMQMSADNYNVSFIIYYQSKSISAPVEDYSNQF